MFQELSKPAPCYVLFGIREKDDADGSISLDEGQNTSVKRSANTGEDHGLLSLKTSPRTLQSDAFMFPPAVR